MSKIIKHKDALSFLLKSENYLQLDEARNNLLIGLANSMKNNQRELDGEELFYTIVDGDEIVGCAIRTNGDTPFTISKIDKQYLPVLTKRLISDNVKLIGINGDIDSVKNFVGIYGVKTKLHMHQGLYELREVIMPKVSGVARIASKDSQEDFEMATEFLRGFMIDCFDEDSAQKAQNLMKRYLEFHKIFLWIVDKRPVAMAARTRQGRDGAAISLVYTPPEYRGRGYASAVTAYCSQYILDQGKSLCYLHTDMKNPISNSIYQKIGYQKLGEFIHYDFVYLDQI